MQNELENEVAVGEQLIFFAYSQPPPDDPIFRPGDLAVCAGGEEQGVMTCFALDPAGQIDWGRGEMLFPEEVIRLRYAPRLDYYAELERFKAREIGRRTVAERCRSEPKARRQSVTKGATK